MDKFREWLENEKERLRVSLRIAQDDYTQGKMQELLNIESAWEEFFSPKKTIKLSEIVERLNEIPDLDIVTQYQDNHNYCYYETEISCYDTLNKKDVLIISISNNSKHIEYINCFDEILMQEIKWLYQLWINQIIIDEVGE